MSFPRVPWWMYIIAASLLGNFAMNIYSYLRGPEPLFSHYTFARDALVVEEVLPNSAADRAGIQALDRVLAIDGRRVRGLGQWDALRINFEVEKPYRLQVERDGKPVDRVMTLQAWSWSRQPQYRRIRVILETASALLTLLVAFLVAFSRPYDWVARIGALSIALLGGLANLYVRLPSSGGCQFSSPRRSGGHRWDLSYFPHCSLPFARSSLVNYFVPAGFGWRMFRHFISCGLFWASPT